jgi:hypothetical protein
METRTWKEGHGSTVLRVMGRGDRNAMQFFPSLRRGAKELATLERVAVGAFYGVGHDAPQCDGVDGFAFGETTQNG